MKFYRALILSGALAALFASNPSGANAQSPSPCEPARKSDVPVGVSAIYDTNTLELKEKKVNLELGTQAAGFGAYAIFLT